MVETEGLAGGENLLIRQLVKVNVLRQTQGIIPLLPQLFAFSLALAWHWLGTGAKK